MNRISSGIEGLDKLMEGGFPAGSLVLVLGSPGSGKSVLAMNIAYGGIAGGRKCIYLTTTDKPDAVKSKMQLFDFSISGHERDMAFIDCSSFSWRGMRAFTAIGGTAAQVETLTTLIKRALEQTGFKEGLIVIDTFSDFLLYFEDEKAVFRFLQAASEAAKELNSVVVVLMEEGVNTIQQVSTANFMSDGVIEMAVKDNRRMMRVAKMADTSYTLDWIEFETKKRAEMYVCVREFFK